MKVAPLPGTFMLTSMLGFLVSALYITQFSKTWSFTFMVVFALMFIASVISASKSDADESLALDALAFHRHGHDGKKEVPSRSKMNSMTKKEMKKYAMEHYGIMLSTNDLKDEMIDKFMKEATSK